MKLDLLRRLNAARNEREATILVTDPETGEARLVVEAEGYGDDPLRDELAARFRSGVSGMIETGGRSLFLTVELPPPRLVLIGAVHISQALAPMAKIAGFDVIIIDPRTAFATPERFPDVRLVAEWPADAISGIGFDAFTAVAALTHDPKIDDTALIAALKAGCFYVGALGSRKTHARRIERLTAAGASPASLATLHAPIGVRIGAQSPAEIGVAILAEVIGALRSRGARVEEAAA
jgi:xanthine dehydrogenase accessory factor